MSSKTRRFDIVQYEFNEAVAVANGVSHQQYVCNLEGKEFPGALISPDEAWGKVAELAQELGALSVIHGMQS
jgi:hypothetical protein